MRSMRVRGRSQALASAPADRLSGNRNSSRRTSPGCMGASFLAIFVIPMCGHSKLVVVDDLNVFRSFLGPDEAHPELIIDPDRMLPLSIPAQSLKLISRRRAQIIQINRSVKIAKLPAGDFHKASWKAFLALALKDCFRHPILEASNHRCQRISV